MGIGSRDKLPVPDEFHTPSLASEQRMKVGADAMTWHVKPPSVALATQMGCRFKSQLLRFQPSSLLVRLGKQQRMV